MPTLIWLPQALLDVQRVHRFLADKNPDAARRAVKAIRESVRILALHPGMGRPANGMDIAFRDWVIDFGDRGYVARYRVSDGVVAILAVRHQLELGVIER